MSSIVDVRSLRNPLFHPTSRQTLPPGRTTTPPQLEHCQVGVEVYSPEAGLDPYSLIRGRKGPAAARDGAWQPAERVCRLTMAAARSCAPSMGLLVVAPAHMCACLLPFLQATFVLYESAVGFGLFEVSEFDEIGQSVEKVQEAVK